MSLKKCLGALMLYFLLLLTGCSDIISGSGGTIKENNVYFNYDSSQADLSISREINSKNIILALTSSQESTQYGLQSKTLNAEVDYNEIYNNSSGVDIGIIEPVILNFSPIDKHTLDKALANQILILVLQENNIYTIVKNNDAYELIFYSEFSGITAIKVPNENLYLTISLENGSINYTLSQDINNEKNEFFDLDELKENKKLNVFNSNKYIISISYEDEQFGLHGKELNNTTDYISIFNLGSTDSSTVLLDDSIVEELGNDKALKHTIYTLIFQDGIIFEVFLDSGKTYLLKRSDDSNIFLRDAPSFTSTSTTTYTIRNTIVPTYMSIELMVTNNLVSYSLEYSETNNERYLKGTITEVLKDKVLFLEDAMSKTYDLYFDSNISLDFLKIALLNTKAEIIIKTISGKDYIDLASFAPYLKVYDLEFISHDQTKNQVTIKKNNELLTFDLYLMRIFYSIDNIVAPIFGNSFDIDDPWDESNILYFEDNNKIINPEGSKLHSIHFTIEDNHNLVLKGLSFVDFPEVQ